MTFDVYLGIWEWEQCPCPIKAWSVEDHRLIGEM